eukprot:TRINITY_DN111168_c0_g1_i1.p1 TRINITY_DN111168_c0_g1~~TRINITY_DN111168_c0_g1_i1.p1  ORF type:complete len:600 (+),score=163.49 TRINITY_DN111168_c0_g1_i1:42-1841(+)
MFECPKAEPGDVYRSLEGRRCMSKLAGAGASIVGGKKKPLRPAIGSIGAYGDWRDSEFVLDELQKNGNAMTHAKELSREKDFVLKAVKVDGRALANVPDKLRGDREVALAAITAYGRALQFASEQLRADHECVMLAVQKNGSAIQFASEELRKDFQIGLAAVSDDGSALQFVHHSLKSNRRLVLKAVQQHSHALQYCTEDLRQDQEIVLAAVKQCRRGLDDEFHNLTWEPKVHALQWAPFFQNDKEVVLSSVSQNGLSLMHASEELRGDYDVAYCAVRENANALQYVVDPTKKIIKDPEIKRLAERRPIIFRPGKFGEEDLLSKIKKYNPEDDPEFAEQRRLQELDAPDKPKPKPPKSKFPKCEGGPGPGEGLYETPAAQITSSLAAVRLRIAEIIGQDLPKEDERTLKQVCRDTQLTLDGRILDAENDTYRRYGEYHDRTLLQAIERSFWEVPDAKGHLEVTLLLPPGAEPGRELTWQVLKEMAEEAKAQALVHKRAGRMNEAMFDFRRMQQYEAECIEKWQAEQDNAAAKKKEEEDKIAFEKAEKKRLAEEEAARKAKEEFERKMNAKKKGKWAKAGGAEGPSEASAASDAPAAPEG